LVCAISVPVVGALLCFSLLIAPTLQAFILQVIPKKVMFLSLFLSLVMVWLSLVLAYLSGLPIGFFVSIIGAFFYGFARLISFYKLKREKFIYCIAQM